MSAGSATRILGEGIPVVVGYLGVGDHFRTKSCLEIKNPTSG